jgi:hypothetical protein
MLAQAITADPIIIGFPTIVKAAIGADGQRLIELEASNENKDSEGDIILQKALLDAAPHYLQCGHIDIDHYSELGRNPAYNYLGIKDPDGWIIGVPTDVKDFGSGRTGIKAEIYKGKDGVSDPSKHKYDMFWESLQTNPPARWFASIYGFPGPDTIKGGGDPYRYLVKSFDWRSTAVTRNPINKNIESTARIITAKAFAAHLPRPFPAEERMFSRSDMRALFHDHLAKSCPSTDFGQQFSIWALRDHFINCDQLTYNSADLYALATGEVIRRELKHRRR